MQLQYDFTVATPLGKRVVCELYIPRCNVKIREVSIDANWSSCISNKWFWCNLWHGLTYKVHGLFRLFPPDQVSINIYIYIYKECLYVSFLPHRVRDTSVAFSWSSDEGMDLTIVLGHLKGIKHQWIEPFLFFNSLPKNREPKRNTSYRRQMLTCLYSFSTVKPNATYFFFLMDLTLQLQLSLYVLHDHFGSIIRVSFSNFVSTPSRLGQTYNYAPNSLSLSLSLSLNPTQSCKVLDLDPNYVV